jgi:F-type H+-transporting ATPase subunit b
MLSTPEFWVAVSFFGFLAILVYVKAPSLIIKALDDRAERIRTELEQAQKLREDAQAMLADYQRKQRDAEKEAEAIVVQAREEAERLAKETREKLAESVERRTQLAEQKIEQAEAQALKEVRAAAAELAVDAARQLIGTEFKPTAAAKLIDKNIKDLKKQLN